MNKFLPLLRRELKLTLHHPSQLLLPALFFLLANAMLLYLTIADILPRIHSGLVLMLLSLLLPLNLLYRTDQQYGFLALLHDTNTPLLCYVYSKNLALFISQAISFVPALMIYAVLIGLPLNMLGIYLLAHVILLFGLSFIGGMIAAPLSHLTQNGLMGLLLLPLLLPLTIFAAATLQQSYFQLDFMPHLLLLAGFSLLTSVLCPFIASKFLSLSQQRW